MEPLRFSMFPFLFLLQFSPVALAYTVPDKYFINCGSDSPVNYDGQDFVGESSLSVCFYPKDSSVVKELNKTLTRTPSLYQTARKFHRPSGYKFTIGENEAGYYLVRLHFYAFSSPETLSRARFNVSSAGFLLLENFSVENKTNSPIVEEFYLNIGSSNRSLQIDFFPAESNFAFVNAIELLRLPHNFIPSMPSHVTSKGNTSDDKSIHSSVLRTSFMLDVGEVDDSDETNDMLRRRWEKDQYFKHGKPISSNVDIEYSDEKEGAVYGLASTDATAPENVYRTARVMTSDSGNRNISFNISWEFPVKRNASYFIRAHFCDIISISVGLTYFNFYIYDNFNWPVRADLWRSAVPFYRDFVVDSDDSGNLRISVGPDEASAVKNAFLNGLQVMEIIRTPGQFANIEYGCKKTKLLLALGVGLGASALICILVVLLCLILKYGKPKIIRTLDWAPLSVKGGGSSHGKRGSSHGSSLGNLKLGLKMSFNEIQSATNNFHTKRIIGRGGFGNVYKGVLKNGVEVAVKRSEPGSSSGQGFPEFQTEIMVLSRIRHRHLVSLIGYCDERSEMLLVYEYMEKGTLRDHLYHSNRPSLPWKQRLEICIGAARGLNYLHKGAAGGIIHRDVKSTNILLDENHVAKVADFGLSKTGLLDHQQEPSVTTGVKGTFGYLDPEYFRTQQLTEKSDVYSFGVVLLEVLCARPALDPTLPWKQVNLAEWGMFCKQRGTLEQLIDPRIKDLIDPNSLRKFSETVGKCLEENGCDRPSMSDVLWDLEYSLQLQRGARQRNSREDTTTSGVTASLELSNVRRLPSLSTQADSEVMSILNDDSAAHSVFSMSNNIHGNR